MKSRLFLVAAILGVFTSVGTVSAAEPLHSPKAKAFAESVQKVHGSTAAFMDRSAQPGTPRGRHLAHSLRRVPLTGNRVDLTRGPRPMLTPKHPRYEAALRELRSGQFQVAPLK